MSATSRSIGAKSRRTYLWDGLLLLGLCAFFFWRDLTPVWADRLGFASGDFANQFYAFAHFAVSRLHDGHLPLWNPYTFAGHPFLADVQAAVFYPFSLLMTAVTALTGFSYRALELEALAHFPLVALSTYLLARRLLDSRPGALVTAIIFTFGGYLTSYPLLQLAILQVEAWLPLILLCLDSAARRLHAGDARGAARRSVAAGLVLGVSFLGGHPQSSLLVVYGCLGFGLYRLLGSHLADRLCGQPAGLALRRARLVQSAGLLALFVLTGVALAAVQLLPSLEFMRLSNRTGIGFEAAGSGFTPYDLLQLILPAVAMPIPALYVGILPLGLAAVSLIHTWQRRRALPAAPGETSLTASPGLVVFWAAAGLLGLLVSFGKNLAVYPLLYILAPGWALFRDQERTVVWFVLAVAMLAGYGAVWLTARPPAPFSPAVPAARAVRRGYLWATLGALALALAFFVGFQAGNQALWGFVTASLGLALFCALSAVTIGSRQPVLVVALIVLDLFTMNPRAHTGPPVVDPFPALPLLEMPLADPGAARLANEYRLPGNYGDVYGLEDIGGDSPLRLARYQKLLDTVPPATVWRLLNVRYVVTWQAVLEVPAEQIARATGADGNPTFLHRLANPAPRAWLVGDVLLVADEDALWQRLAAPDFDPLHQVILEQTPPQGMPDPGCRGEVQWITREPERLTLQVTTDQRCILVLSELVYPGWLASVNGSSVPILQADGLLRAVQIDAGSQRVEMLFRPLSLYAGAALSILALVLALAWLWSGRQTR